MSGASRQRVICPAIASLGVAILVACTGFVGDVGVLEGFVGRFAQVEIGQSSQAALETLVSPPTKESSTLELPQQDGYEQLYEEATGSGATRFLYWETGIDEVAVLGFDEADTVVFKCRAGT
jgi:hypothetical protein